MRRIVLLLVCLQAMIPPVTGTGSIIEHSTTSFDVFPLTRNLYYIYDYRSQYRVTEVAVTVQLDVDSGWVEYVVHDSIMVNDSTIAWYLEERQTLWHRRYNLYLGRDSMYWTRDSLFFQLYETTSGRHEIRSSGLIWNFPLSTPNQSVYRFADSTQISLARQWSTPSPPGSGVDTLQFSQVRGLFQRHRSYFGGGITRYSSSLNVALRGNPVVAVRGDRAYPTAFDLKQNYPNPFNPTTTIEYLLPFSSFVSLSIYDILGREIAILDEGIRKAGAHSVTLNSSNLASGVYLYRLTSGSVHQTKKLILLK